MKLTRIIPVLQVRMVVFQVLLCQREHHFPLFPLLQEDAPESFQFLDGTCHLSHHITQIELYDFRTVTSTGIGDLHRNRQFSVLGKAFRTKPYIAILKSRIAQPEPERIKRFITLVNIVTLVGVLPHILRIGATGTQMDIV